MPIEIRELVIKSTITEPGNKAGANGEKNNQVNMDRIVAECAERVLEILKENSER